MFKVSSGCYKISQIINICLNTVQFIQKMGEEHATIANLSRQLNQAFQTSDLNGWCPATFRSVPQIPLNYLIISSGMLNHKSV